MSEYTCEASTSVVTSGIAPQVIMCRKPAKLRKGILNPFEVAMCDECYEAWKRKLDAFK